MFLGTSRRWWIATALLFVLGLALVETGVAGTLGRVGGVLLVLVAIVVFAVAPMRYGQGARPPTKQPPAAPAPTTSAGPRPTIEARDASEV
jgi:drug/metabolite transporter (DMT)-like permease